jgi:hypothetical protein
LGLQFGSTLIDAHTLPGKLALACLQATDRRVVKGWLRMGGRRNGWMGGRRVRYGWMGGFAKVDNRFGYEKWT